jgi:prolyl 4-hydroxylase
MNRPHSASPDVAIGASVARASAKVAEAAEYDARGEHDRAVQVLADACRQGDAEAMTRLGRRLLVGEGAPHQPEEGTELLVRAANLGVAEAAAQVAVLSALGMHLPQDWRTALVAMRFAAELGSAAARGQLRVLAGDRELAAANLEAGQIQPGFWGQLAETIDLNRWHTPSVGATLSDSPLVRLFADFATADVCRWLIDRARGRLSRAPVYDAFKREETISHERTNTWALFDVNHADLVSVLVQAHMCANTGLAFRQLEPLAVLHYDVGEQSKEHFDFIDPRTPHHRQEVMEKGQRIVTFLIYLNDDYEGGCTELIDLGIAHKGRLGEGLFFVNALTNGEPDTRTLHAGRPPTSGEKWVVSQFIRNRQTF